LRSPDQRPPQAVRNQVLATLDEEAFGLLKPHLKRVELRRNAILLEANRPIESVYFIERGLVSRFAATPEDAPVETAIVGWFGFVGIGVVLGSERSLHRSVVQVAGEAITIPAETLREILETHSPIRDHLLKYVQLLIGLKAQIALCNAKHSIEQRVARWLLLAADRMDSNELPVTHESLAQTLGVRRPGVSDALSVLEDQSIVSKSRAAITLLRKDLLAEKSCACYRTIAGKYGAMSNLKHFAHELA
jgi:CRP-like cAMP-binding protein